MDGQLEQLQAIFPAIDVNIINLALQCSNNDFDRALEGLLQYVESSAAPKSSSSSNSSDSITFRVISFKDRKKENLSVPLNTKIAELTALLKEKYGEGSLYHAVRTGTSPTNPDGVVTTTSISGDERKLSEFSNLWNQSKDIRWYNPAQGELKLFVKELTGFTMTVRISLADTIETFKQHVEAITSKTPDAQRLIFAGKQLEDGRTCQEYNMHNGATLHLVDRLRGD